MDVLLSLAVVLALLGAVAAIAGYESRDGFETHDR
jgi:hypothetical protein